MNSNYTTEFGSLICAPEWFPKDSITTKVVWLLSWAWGGATRHILL